MFSHLTARALWTLGLHRVRALSEYPAKDLRGCDGVHVDDRAPKMLGDHEVDGLRDGRHQVTCQRCAVLMDAALEAAE